MKDNSLKGSKDVYDHLTLHGMCIKNKDNQI